MLKKHVHDFDVIIIQVAHPNLGKVYRWRHHYLRQLKSSFVISYVVYIYPSIPSISEWKVPAVLCNFCQKQVKIF